MARTAKYSKVRGKKAGEKGGQQRRKKEDILNPFRSGLGATSLLDRGPASGVRMVRFTSDPPLQALCALGQVT